MCTPKSRHCVSTNIAINRLRIPREICKRNQPTFGGLTRNQIETPAERVRFGEEEQRSEREMTFDAKHKKSSQAIRSLRRRGDPYGTPRLRASRVAALTCPRHVIHYRSLRVPREICKKRNQPTFGGLISFGDPYGTRTHVTAVKGRCLNHLTNGPYSGSGTWIRTGDTAGMNRML